MDNDKLITKHNRADIKRETFDDHPMQTNSRMNMMLAGKNLAPWGFEYCGTAAVHFYAKPGTNDYVFIEHLSGLSGVPEAQADVGIKELRKATMKAYGREDTRRTDTKEEIL